MNDYLKKAASLSDDAALLLAGIRQARPDLRDFLVTGCAGGEGASTVAVACATAAKRIESARVLLIDADLENNSLTNSWGLGGRDGLQQIGESGAAYSQFCATVANGIDLLPSGSRMTGHMVDAEANRVFQALREQSTNDYDMVIWDTSPISKSAETRLIAMTVPNIVLVAQSARTQLSQFARSLEEIRRLGIAPVAVVRNRA
jgi:Mrp family chromosome partitioning ATPase